MHGRRVIYISLVVEPNDGGYLARCPGVQGAFAEGDTIEEAIFNCIDVVKMIADYRRGRGESIGVGEVELVPEAQVAASIPVGIER